MRKARGGVSCVPLDTLPGQVWKLRSQSLSVGETKTTSLQVFRKASAEIEVPFGSNFTLTTSDLDKALAAAREARGIPKYVACSCADKVTSLAVSYNDLGSTGATWSWVVAFSIAEIEWGSPCTWTSLATVSWDVADSLLSTFLSLAFGIEPPSLRPGIRRSTRPLRGHSESSDAMKQRFLSALQEIFVVGAADWTPAPHLVGGDKTISLTLSTENKGDFFVELDCTSGSVQAYHLHGAKLVQLEAGVPKLKSLVEGEGSNFVGLSVHQCFEFPASMFAQRGFDWEADVAGASLRFSVAISALKAKMLSTQRRVRETIMDTVSTPLTVAEVANAFLSLKLPRPGILTVRLSGQCLEMAQGTDEVESLLEMNKTFPGKGKQTVLDIVISSSSSISLPEPVRALRLNKFLGQKAGLMDELVGVVNVEWFSSGADPRDAPTLSLLPVGGGNVKVVTGSEYVSVWPRKDLTRALAVIMNPDGVITPSKAQEVLKNFTSKLDVRGTSGSSAKIRAMFYRRDQPDDHFVQVVSECAKACLGSEVGFVALESMGDRMYEHMGTITCEDRSRLVGMHREMELLPKEVAAILRVYDLENVRSTLTPIVHETYLLDVMEGDLSVSEIVLNAYVRLFGLCLKHESEGKESLVGTNFLSYPSPTPSLSSSTTEGKDLVRLCLNVDEGTLSSVSKHLAGLCFFWQCATRPYKENFVEGVLHTVFASQFPAWKMVHPEFVVQATDNWMQEMVNGFLFNLKNRTRHYAGAGTGTGIVYAYIEGAARIAGIDVERVLGIFPWPIPTESGTFRKHMRRVFSKISLKGLDDALSPQKR